MRYGKAVKKAISVILVLVMVMAQMPVSYAADAEVSVTWNLTDNISVNAAVSTVEAEQGLTAVFSAGTGYILPDSISVTGATSYDYSPETGALSISAEQITGDLVITASAAIQVSWNLTGISATPAVTSISEGDAFSCTLSADQGYSLPDTITVTGPSTFTYTKDDGSLLIAAEDISSGISIQAEGVKNQYSVSVAADSSEYITLDNDTALFDTEVSLSVSERTGYVVEKINVIADGGASATASENGGKYSFSMPADNVTVGVVWKFSEAGITVKSGDDELTAVDGWYSASSATVYPVAPATQISDAEAGPYAASVAVSEGTTDIYLSDEEGQKIGPFSVKLDATAPESDMKKNGTSMTHDYENDIYSSSTVTIESTDSGSGVGTVKYAFLTQSDYDKIVTDHSLTKTLSESELSEINKKIGSGWKTYSSGVDLSSLRNKTYYVIAVQTSDKVGNVSYEFYGAYYENQAPKLTITVCDTGTGIWEKKGTVYHLKDTDATDDKVTLRIDYDSNRSPSSSSVTVKCGDSNLTIGTEFSVTGWTKDDSTNTMMCNVEIYIDAIEDGTITVNASASRFWSSYADSVEMSLSRKTPAVEIGYQNFSGYDEGTSYKTSGSPKDTVDAADDGASFTSEKKFYVNSGKNFVISLSSGTDIISSWAATASINGAAAADVSSVAGITADVSGQKLTISGTDAAEGEYVLSFTVTGFNGCSETLNTKVVVDRTGPAADDITGQGFTDNAGEIVLGKTVADGVWTNENNITLTLSNVSDDFGLPEECVSASAGLTGGKTLTDGTWTGTVSGEQNHKYSVVITDKAGNTTTKEFTVKVDTTEVKSITVKARHDAEDMALIADQLTFGVFHVDYDRLSVSLEDAQPGNPKTYDDDEKTSEVSTVEYYFLTSQSSEYAELFSYLDSDSVKQYYTQDDVKNNSTAKDTVNANIQAYLDGIKTQAKGAGVWSDCVRDATDNPNKVATGLVASNQQYVVFFRVWDNAGNMSAFYRTLVITDDKAPQVSFSIDTTAEHIDLPNGSVIYTGAVPVTITITEPNSDTAAYSGINTATYTVYYGDEEEFTSGSFDSLANLDVANKGEAVADESKELNQQGTNQTSKVVTLDDMSGKIIDATNIYIKVDVQDISGNSSSYTSDAQIGFINIDKTAPEVSVDFSGGTLNGRYYGSDRTAVITVIDSNFDPESCITLDATGALGDWTVTETDDYGKSTYTAEMVFSDGEHHFSITEVKDLAEHKLTDADVTYNATDMDSFIVDTIPPVAAITFERADKKTFSDYNNDDVIMTITVSEKNFSTGGANLSVAKDGTGIYVGLTWSRNGDTYTAKYTFEEEGAYSINFSVTDMAGHSDTLDTEKFVIDKTAPTIEIENVEDQKSYNAESVTPLVRVTDTNYSDIGVDIVLTGANGGEGFFDETDIANGQEFLFESIEEDDLYTLTVTATDEAENETVMTITFSVNRNGSVFSGGEELAKALEDGLPYFRTETLPPVEIVETNVDIIQSAKIYLTKDNSNVDLEEGKDYTIKREDVNGGWSQYTYSLNDDLFLEDGVYRVSLVTVDAAGNAKNAESVVAFIVDNTLPVLLPTDFESRAIYNEEVKHVVFTPKDNLVLSKIQIILNGEEIAVWEGEELEEMLRSGAEFSFDIPQSNSRQNAQIILTDAAGNENENQLFENFLVSTNAFIRFYNNKPLFFGSIAGAAALGGVIWWFIIAKRKKDEEEEEQK